MSAPERVSEMWECRPTCFGIYSPHHGLLRGREGRCGEKSDSILFNPDGMPMIWEGE